MHQDKPHSKQEWIALYFCKAVLHHYQGQPVYAQAALQKAMQLNNGRK